MIGFEELCTGIAKRRQEEEEEGGDDMGLSPVGVEGLNLPPPPPPPSSSCSIYNPSPTLPESAMDRTLSDEPLLRHLLTQYLTTADQLLHVQTVCKAWQEIIRTQQKVCLQIPQIKHPDGSLSWMQPHGIKSFLRAVQSRLTPSSVQAINFQGQMIEDAELHRVLSYFRSHLCSLKLDGCPRITDEGLTSLSHCHRLTHLSLRGCRYVEGTCLRGVKSLHHLDMAFTMTPLASLGNILAAEAKTEMAIVGTPAIFELAFGYSQRAQLEALLLRLQMGINSANFEEAKACLQLGTKMPPIKVMAGGGPDGPVKATIPVLALLLDGPFTDYHVSSLMLAAYMGHHELVKLLLEFGGDVSARAVGGGTCLHIACRVGNLAIAKLLLDHGTSPSVRTQNGSAPLHTVASHRGKPELASLLLDNGAFVDDQAVDGITALHIACQKGCLDMCQLLIRRGADVSRLNNNGFSTLIYASHYGHSAVVKLLLENNAPDVCDSSGARALHHATQAGHSEVVKTLVDFGCDLHAKTLTGKTPLQCAAFEGNTEIVQLLLDRGADMHDRTSKGRNALYYAARNGHAGVLQVLLAHAAASQGLKRDLDKKAALLCASRKGHTQVVKVLLEGFRADLDEDFRDEQGHGPLHIASEYGHEGLVQYLVDYGLPVNDATCRGQTPLQYASWRGFHLIVDYLLDCGADPNARNSSGRTCLQGACHKGHEKVVRSLLAHGVEINAAAHDGYTALHNASLKGRLEITALLLEHGAQLDDRTLKGNTPLHLCCQAGHAEIASLLLRHGANVHDANKEGGLPHHGACWRGHENIVKMLVDAGADLSAATKTISVQGKTATALDVAVARGHDKVAAYLRQALGEKRL